MINELNAKHIKTLKDTLALYSDLKDEGREVEQKEKIEKVRADLNN